MNIFVLDECPLEAAKLHNDKHCVKMIVEIAQLLCSVHWVNGKEAPYKLTHKNHPCSIWARECYENYFWLTLLGRALCLEYSHRYGKIHKTEAVIDWCSKNKPTFLKSNGETTEFALAMPDDCKVGGAVESYKEYYKKHKQTWSRKNKNTGEVVMIEHAWTKREKPNWM